MKKMLMSLVLVIIVATPSLAEASTTLYGYCWAYGSGSSSAYYISDVFTMNCKEDSTYDARLGAGASCGESKIESQFRDYLKEEVSRSTNPASCRSDDSKGEIVQRRNKSIGGKNNVRKLRGFSYYPK